MWRARGNPNRHLAVKVALTMTLICVGISEFIDVPSRTSDIKSEQAEFPFLSISSITPVTQLESVATPQPVVNSSTVVVQENYLDRRFVGLLSHFRWMLERQQPSFSDTELNRINKQFEFVDDVDAGEVAERLHCQN